MSLFVAALLICPSKKNKSSRNKIRRFEDFGMLRTGSRYYYVSGVNSWSSTGNKKIEKINATAPQPQRNVLKYFAIFKHVAHTCNLEPGETPSYSASQQTPNYVQRS